jgi:hypothetical protein
MTAPVLSIYVTALLIGGVLLGLSLLGTPGNDSASGGGDAHAHDGEAGANADAHGADADDADHVPVGGGHLVLEALPIFSLSFWTYFLTFSGLTGVALSVLGGLSPVTVGGLSAAMGYLSGQGIRRLIQALRREDVSGAIGARDFVGTLATVLLPIRKGGPGKIRVRLKGREVDLIAFSEDPAELLERQQVMIHNVLGDGSVQVVSAEEPPATLARGEKERGS